jgi:CoA:oxalate CoA-transferase
MDQPELASDPRFSDVVPRKANAELIEKYVAEWVARSTVDEIGEALTAEGIPWGPVASLPEVIESVQVAAREMLVTVDHPTLGPIKVPGNPIKLSKSPGKLRLAPPLVGQDTDGVLAGLGYSLSDISALRAVGAI